MKRDLLAGKNADIPQEAMTEFNEAVRSKSRGRITKIFKRWCEVTWDLEPPCR